MKSKVCYAKQLNIFQDLALDEEFLQNLSLRLADCIIVVMNETTYQDQNLLYKIQRRWASLCRTDHSEKGRRRNLDVYVIHNFERASSAAERDRLFEVLHIRELIQNTSHTCVYFLL